MSPRLLVLALAPLFATATASAQAPGEWSPPPAPDGPAYRPAPPPPQRETRFSIGLTIGQTELSPSDYDQSVQFDGAAIAFRYRPWDHLELELTLGGGRQSYGEGDNLEQGELAMGSGTLAARYRFNPNARWNYWLLAGFGVTTVAPHDASDDVIEAAQRPHATFGGGLEWRFNRHWSLQFELRALAVGQTNEEMELEDQGYQVTDSWSGGSFAFGANLYF